MQSYTYLDIKPKFTAKLKERIFFLFSEELFSAAVFLKSRLEPEKKIENC